MPEQAKPAHLAHHAGRIRLEHLDTTHAAHSPKQNGPIAWWADGTTSYVLHTRSGQVHGFAVADEADTVIQALDALRAGEDMTPGYLTRTLADIRRLRSRLEALEAELILYAREAGPKGRPRLTFRELGDALELNHTTVMERHSRLTDRETVPAWRNWLVQGTSREHTPPWPSPAVTLEEQVEMAPGGTFLAEAIPMDPTGYVITVTDYATEPDQILRIDLPDWDRFRAPSAGHRLIEHGFSVLPAAHFETDRLAGWKPGVDVLTYSAPVFRLPQDDQAEPPGAYCACADPECPTPDGQYTHG